MRNVKKALTILGLLLFSSFFAAIQAQTKGDIAGNYIIQNPPKVFADITEINLAGNRGAQKVPVEYGEIRTKGKNAVYCEIVNVELNGKNIAFTASSIGAESPDPKTQNAETAYKFVGKFTKFPDDADQNGVILEGTLTKIKGKKTIAAAKVKFRYKKGD